jgi:hypothetical protein
VSWWESFDATIDSINASRCDLARTAATTRAESIMKQCGEQWQAAKAAGTTSGATWPQFLAQCRTQLGSGAATAAPTPAAVQPQTGSLFPWQQTGISSTSSDHLDDRRKPKCDERMRRTVASCKGGGHNRRRNLAAVPKGLSRAARIKDKHSPRRLRSGRTSAGSCTFSGTDVIGFIISVAAVSRSARWEHRVDRSRVGAGSSVSLSRIDGRFGSMSTRTSTISPEPGITATRKAALTCARRRLKPQAIAPR